MIQEMRTRFLDAAANPGLDLSEGVDPWIVANDYCGMLATVLTAIGRLTLLTLHRLSPIELEGSSTWSPFAWKDDSGVLHRWITVDGYDDGVLARECHGWKVFGDICVCDAPLTLHVVSIGQQRGGRRQSPWARAFKDPVIAGRFKFQRGNRRSGHSPLQGDWRPLWYADQTHPDPEAWCDVMDREEVTPSLLHHIPIAQPSEAVRRDTLDQIARLASQMSRLGSEHPRNSGGMELPMSRGACDGWVPCPWQQACFVEPGELHDIGRHGLYQIRAAAPYASSSIRGVDEGDYATTGA